MENKKITITAALPYANGPVHIGHLAGCYLPADIYARYLRGKGKDVIFVCGSDEHGVPITIRARKEGRTPQQVVDEFHEQIKTSFKDFHISFDIYSRTSSPDHHKLAGDFFKTLYDKGVFTEEETEQYYDEQEKQFLADRYITGKCPNCGIDNAYGDQCEKCGSTLSPNELINPVSALSGNKPILKKTTNWFLPLDKIQNEFLNDFIGSKTHWKSNVLGQCKSWLNEGLRPRAMTRDLDWGVKVPLPNTEGKVLYVWFDAPLGYITNTKQLKPDNWMQYWDKDAEIIHFIGKDNIVFHCIIFPAMLHLHGGYGLPTYVPANEFLNLEGDKISTSRNWAVWLHEYLHDFPGKTDELRYVLTSILPENKDSEFTWKDYQARVNNELVAILGNLVNRVVILFQKYTDGVVQHLSEADNGFDLILHEAKETAERVEKHIEKFEFRDALHQLMNIARIGNKFLADLEPWHLIKTDKEKAADVLLVAAQICKIFTSVSEPLLPSTTFKINEVLGDLQPGSLIKDNGLLFQKIEDADMDKQIAKLESTKVNNKPAESAPQLKSIQPEIVYDDFAKIDIRVAEIVAAEKVEKADKLLKLTLNTGVDERIVMSGIAEFFKPEDIIGKQVLVLVNLAPRKLRGVESNGMILMAEDPEGKLSFVSPEQGWTNGAIVK